MLFLPYTCRIMLAFYACTLQDHAHSMLVLEACSQPCKMLKKIVIFALFFCISQRCMLWYMHEACSCTPYTSACFLCMFAVPVHDASWCIFLLFHMWVHFLIFPVWCLTMLDADFVHALRDSMRMNACSWYSACRKVCTRTLQKSRLWLVHSEFKKKKNGVFLRSDKLFF